MEPSIQHFTVEMAPLEYMPHAVKLFLEQVIHGLWDNGWFYINGPHVIQGGPMVPDENDFDHLYQDERSAALHPFRELQLDTLAFPEYSESFPHQPYTLGFTGRPGTLFRLCRFLGLLIQRALRRGPGFLHQQGRQHGRTWTWWTISPRT